MAAADLRASFYHTIQGLHVSIIKRKLMMMHDGRTSLRLSSEYGTHNALKTRFWPWLSGKILLNLSGVEGRAISHTTSPAWSHPGSEEGSYLRLIDFFITRLLGLRVIKQKSEGRTPLPLSSEYGTYNAAKTRFWPWLSGKSQ